MAEIINLRQARKRASRRDADAKAAENRTAFGRSKRLKATALQEKTRTENNLDGKLLERHGPQSDDAGQVLSSVPPQPLPDSREE